MLHMIGLRIQRAAPSEIQSHLLYKRVFPLVVISRLRACVSQASSLGRQVVSVPGNVAIGAKKSEGLTNLHPQGAEARFERLMLKHASPPIDPPTLDAAHAARLPERTANVPFFAHSCSFYRSMEHGFAPRDLVDFVYIHDLHGACPHLNDGGEASVGKMSGKDREVFRRQLE